MSTTTIDLMLFSSMNTVSDMYNHIRFVNNISHMSIGLAKSHLTLSEFTS